MLQGCEAQGSGFPKKKSEKEEIDKVLGVASQSGFARFVQIDRVLFINVLLDAE